jgi:hypothetical protein
MGYNPGMRSIWIAVVAGCAGPSEDTGDAFAYRGGWPVQPDKDAFDGPELSEAEPEVGATFARLRLPDQHGETVDLYDFAGQDRPVMIVLSAQWSGGSNGLAAWVSGDGEAYGWLADYPGVRDLVDDGRIYWVNLYAEDQDGSAPDPQEVTAWADAYPHPRVPVLGATPEIGAVYAPEWPALYWLDADMRIGAVALEAMDEAEAYGR